MLALYGGGGGGGGHHHHGGGGGGGYRYYGGGGGYAPYYYAPDVTVISTDCVRDPQDYRRCCPPERIVSGHCITLDPLHGATTGTIPTSVKMVGLLLGIGGLLWVMHKGKR